MCCCKVALVKLECLEVETGRFEVCAAQEVNIYAKVSCEMQEVERTVSTAARGGLGSGFFGPIQSTSSEPLACLNKVHSFSDFKDFE